MSITLIATSNIIYISITNRQSYNSKVLGRYLHSPGSHQSTRFNSVTLWYIRSMAILKKEQTIICPLEHDFFLSANQIQKNFKKNTTLARFSTLIVWRRRRTASTAASSFFICFSARIFSPFSRARARATIAMSRSSCRLRLARVSSLSLCSLALLFWLRPSVGPQIFWRPKASSWYLQQISWNSRPCNSQCQWWWWHCQCCWW